MATLRVWNGITFVPAAIRVPTTPLLLTQNFEFGQGFYLPTGLREDPNHPGLYFPDGLPPSYLGPGFYETGL